MGEKAVKVSKYLLVTFNALFLLAGLGVLAGGIWIVVDSSSFSNTFSQFLNVGSLLYNWVGYIAIAFGALVGFVAFLGCCGAISENKCLLRSFFVIILIFALLEIAVGIVVLVYAGNLKPLLEDPVKDIIKNTYLPGTSIKDTYDKIQTDQQCCGFNNGSDYAGSAYANTHQNTNPWPPSCCSNQTNHDGCLNQNPPTDSNSDKGCFDRISDILISYSAVIGGVSLGLAAIKICSMVLACCVYCGIGQNGTARVGPFGHS